MCTKLGLMSVMFVAPLVDEDAGKRDGGTELGLISAMLVAPLADEDADKRDGGTKVGVMSVMFVEPLVDEDADKRDGCTKLELSTELKARGDIVACDVSRMVDEAAVAGVAEGLGTN